MTLNLRQWRLAWFQKFSIPFIMIMLFCKVCAVIDAKIVIGLYQVSASVSEGLWYARSEGFLQQDFLETLRWLRTIGDVILILGALLFAYEVTKLTFSRRNH